MDNVIQLHEITKRFGSVVPLDNISVDIGSGVTGLLGPNGAGKSTLIKIILGLLKPTRGQGSVLGHDLLRRSMSVRSKVGYMPEDDCYFAGLTGIESVQTAARMSRFPKLEGLRRAHEILDFCGAGQERYRDVGTYSTGMRQKLRFAQAIVHDPPLLILDEPTSGLDPEERESMLNRIKVLAREHGKSIVICTHILPDVQEVSDAVVILAKGKVSVADSLEVLSRPVAPSVEIRTVGAHEDFLAKLSDFGFHVERMERNILKVGGADPDASQTIWKLASETKTTIRALSPARNSLEQIFIDAVKGQPDATA